MKAEARIRAFWVDCLEPVPQSTFDNLFLPSQTINFLTDVGLPTAPIRHRGRNIRFMPSQTKIVSLKEIEYLNIGHFENTGLPFVNSICINTSTGAVYYDNSPTVNFDINAFGHSTSIPLYYMNKDTQSLLLYFIAFFENLRPLGKLESEFANILEQRGANRDELRKIVKTIQLEKKQIVQKLKTELNIIDASPLDTAQDKGMANYWLEEYLDIMLF